MVSESSVLLALPMRKFTRLQAAPSFYGALCSSVFDVQLGISLSLDFIDSFSNSFRFGFIIFSSESSVLLALPMRKSFLFYTKK